MTTNEKTQIGTVGSGWAKCPCYESGNSEFPIKVLLNRDTHYPCLVKSMEVATLLADACHQYGATWAVDGLWFRFPIVRWDENPSDVLSEIQVQGLGFFQMDWESGSELASVGAFQTDVYAFRSEARKSGGWDEFVLFRKPGQARYTVTVQRRGGKRSRTRYTAYSK